MTVRLIVNVWGLPVNRAKYGDLMMSIRHIILISAICAGVTCAIFFLCPTAHIAKAQDISSLLEDDESGLLIDDAALEPYRQAEPVNGGLPSLPAVWIFIMGMVAMIAIPVFWIVFKKKNDT
jgi:hypothetical protein